MKTKLSSTNSFRIATATLFFLLPGLAYMTDAQQTSVKPVTDIMEVMKEHAAISQINLWPGFDPERIPVAVYDSSRTWLFFSEQPPEGFNPDEDFKGVFVFEGQYPPVRGNSVVRFGDAWTATSVLSNYSRRTDERYTPRDMAGIIVHEQFHVFQRTNHPRWRQNDGVLLFYPEETREALFLRRIEKEAFKKAVLSKSDEEIAGWSLTAMNYRKERLKMIQAQLGNYEKDLQHTEGLSDYIERIARGVDPLNASNMTNGIAPAGVRDLGYWEGRWIAMILDRLDPDWKNLLETNDSLWLEDILESELHNALAKGLAFSDSEVSRIKAGAEKDFDEWQIKKAEEIEDYKNLPGYRIEINSLAEPLNIRIFEPLEIEILPDRAVFHRVIFSAANQKGNIRILNHPCITGFNEAYRLVKLVLNGLPVAPEVNREEKKLVLKHEGITLELNYTEITTDVSGYFVNL